MNERWYVVLNLEEGPTTYQVHCNGKIVASGLPTPEAAEEMCRLRNAPHEPGGAGSGVLPAASQAS